LMANGLQSFFANWNGPKPYKQASKLSVAGGGFTVAAGWAASSTAYRSDQAANYLNRWGGAFSLVPELADLREAWTSWTESPRLSAVLVARAVAIVVAFGFTWLATAESDETSDERTQRLNAIFASVFPFIATMFGIGAEALRPTPLLTEQMEEQVQRLRHQEEGRGSRAESPTADNIGLPPSEAVLPE
jgi:hypothetical protein